MNPSRREVRATQAFFEGLDDQLGDERGPNGEPSSYDFQSYELFAIVERFAEDWDRLPELITGRSDYRVFVGTGMLVAGFVVTGQLASDGAVELVSIEIDPRGGVDLFLTHRRQIVDAERLPEGSSYRHDRIGARGVLTVGTRSGRTPKCAPVAELWIVVAGWFRFPGQSRR